MHLLHGDGTAIHLPHKKPAPYHHCTRLIRGNMLLRRSPAGRVRDPASGETVEKVVFAVFFAGDRAKQKVLKVSSSELG